MNPIVSLILVLIICVPLGGAALWLAGFFERDAKSKKVTQFYSNRWMTKSEANRLYLYTTLSSIRTMKKTGPLVRFEASGHEVQINMVPKDFHTIILGTTGSGKTQGYIMPMIYTLAHTEQKPNMIITDPKGEIYAMLSETLRRQGYDVQVFNLSEPTKSSRWNPFEDSWNKFQRANNLDREMKKHVNADPKSLGLRIIASQYPNEWYEFNKIAFPTFAMADMERKTLKQRLLSEAEGEIKDICAAIAPTLIEKDPSWEDGARDLINGTALAMLEDSLNPNLGMTREKFNFYNIFKTLGIRDNNPDNMFETIQRYFQGRDRLSAAVQLANTVVSNAPKTMQNFFGMVTQKLSMFADKGICYITSGTEIHFENFIKRPTAFFLIIPDQIKIRHSLATLCVAQLYKALVNMANSCGGKLPRMTYFILDEFGNMPKLNDFPTLITVARSRGIQFSIVLQDYKQLETTYGPNEAVTIKNNCNVQIFVGVNDMETRKEFSEKLGEMAIEVETSGSSKSLDKDLKDGKGDSVSTNKSIVSRPLLPPNELLDLKPGVIYVYAFLFNPFKSMVTPFWQCLQNNLVQAYKDPNPDKFVASKYFDEEAIFYDVTRRNNLILNSAKKNDVFDW